MAKFGSFKYGDGTKYGLQKLLSDAIAVTENLKRAAAKFFIESQVFSEVFEVLRVISKVFIDYVVFVESFLRGIGKVVVDTVSIAESLSRSIVRALSDVVNYVDTTTKGIGRAFLDTINITDSWLRGFGKILTENITLTETFEKLKIIIKEFIENISFTETFTRIWDKFYGVFDWLKSSSQEDKAASLQTEVKPSIGDDSKQSFMSSSQDTPSGSIFDDSKPSL